MSKPSICIIVFSDLAIDARVNRQIKALTNQAKITVLSTGRSYIDNVEYIVLKSKKKISTKVKFIAYLLIRRYEQFYWSQPIVKEVISSLDDRQFDVFIANDLETLPLAINLAKRCKGKVFFDAHEYAPLEFDNRWSWKYFHQPYREYLCNHYLQKVDVMTTVCDGIANKYREEYNVFPKVILNTPAYQNVSCRPASNLHKIKLIHHGSASPDRHIEKMIEMIPYLDARFEVHFMMVGNAKYIRKLKILAKKIAPNRITFHAPVTIENICKKLSDYDIGFYLLQPIGFNYVYAMPNKLFDFLMSGLCIAIAPSIEMKKIVDFYECGVTARDFTPKNLAEAINGLSIESINKSKIAALEAAKILNSEIESKKIQDIVSSLLK